MTGGQLNQLRGDGLVEPVGAKTVPKPHGSGQPQQTWKRCEP